MQLPSGWQVSAFADEISDDLDLALGELTRAGIQLFDLRSAFGKNVVDLNSDDIKAVQFSMRAVRMGVYSIGSPVNKRPYNPEDWHLEHAKLKKACALASQVGAQCVRIFSPFVSEHGPSLEECVDILEHQLSIAA